MDERDRHPYRDVFLDVVVVHAVAVGKPDALAVRTGRARPGSRPIRAGPEHGQPDPAREGSGRRAGAVVAAQEGGGVAAEPAGAAAGVGEGAAEEGDDGGDRGEDTEPEGGGNGVR